MAYPELNWEITVIDDEENSSNCQSKERKFGRKESQFVELPKFEKKLDKLQGKVNQNFQEFRKEITNNHISTTKSSGKVLKKRSFRSTAVKISISTDGSSGKQ